MADQVAITILAVLGGVILSGAVFFVVGRRMERRAAEAAGRSAEQMAVRVREDGVRAAEAAKAEALLAAREENMQAREDLEREIKDRRDESDRQQERLEQRQALIDRKLSALDDKGQQLDRRTQRVEEREQDLERKETEVARLDVERRKRLERIAGLSSEQAKAELMQAMTDAAKSDCAALVRDLREEAKRTAERDAKKIVALAIQRVSAEHTTESTVSAVALPSDEMKGRIIGREGRNIRAFETATGVDVIIDDTPDTVVVSCFDPIRREVGRRALEQLIADGRIHPGRIEEVVGKVRTELEGQLVEAGEQAAYELGIHGLHPELVKLIGRMKYRTSYGQNMYAHSQEVAWLAGIMAAELKLDVQLARRGGLLHDIGKVMTHQVDGTHVELGVQVAEKYGEDPVVINAIAAHHDDVAHETPISVLVQAADAASGARPGARRESFETYVKRLTNLEEIAGGYAGVEKAYAIQAGRELRIVVEPESVSDETASELSEQIARRVEQELQYPGQIKVVVIRETRAVDFAR